MTTRSWVIVVVVAFLAGGVLAGGQKTAEAIGQADAYREQLKVALDSLELAREAQAAADSQRVAVDRSAAAEIAAADARRLQAERRSDAAAARRPEVIERVIREAGVDSSAVRRAVQEVADSIVSYEVIPLRVALAEAMRVIAVKDSQLAARDSQIAVRDRVQANLVSALTASQSEAAALRDALPGWVGRNWAKVAIPVGFGLGWYARELLRQPPPRGMAPFTPAAPDE